MQDDKTAVSDRIVSVYKTKKKCIAASAVAVCTVCALLGALVFSAASGGILKSDAAAESAGLFILLLLPCAAIAVLALLYFINICRRRIVLTPDFFEYRNGAAVKVSIRLHNLRAASLSNGMLSLYYALPDVRYAFAELYAAQSESVPNESLPEAPCSVPAKNDREETIAVVRIGTFGFFYGADDILERLGAYAEPVLDREAAEDMMEMAKSGTVANAEEAGLLLRKVRFYASVINGIGIAIALWLSIFPHPFKHAVLIAAEYPIFVLFVLYISKGRIRFDKKGNSLYPSVCLAVIAPAMALAFSGLNRYSWADGAACLRVSLAATGIYMLLFCLFQREFSFKRAYTYLALALYSLFFFCYGFGASWTLNCAFDSSAPVHTRMQKGTESQTVALYKGFFGIKWYYDGQAE